MTDQNPHTTSKRVVVHLVYRLSIGGMEQVLLDTVNGLDEAFKHIVVSLTDTTEWHLQQLPADTVFISFEKPPGHMWSIWFHVYRILKLHNASVLHTYNIGTLEYQIVAALAGISVRIHAEHGRDSRDPDGTYWKHRLLRRLVNVFVHFWVAVSTDLEKWLIDQIKIPRRKVRLIKNGIAIVSVDNIDQPCNYRMSEWPEGFRGSCSAMDFVIGHVGRLDPVKNQELLVDALVVLNANHYYEKGLYRLCIVGDGVEFERLHWKVQNEKMEEQVWLAGSRNDVKQLIPGFDVFALTSIAEGTPVALLEAMSQQVPVISSAVGGVPELLSKGAGVLFQSGNVNELVDSIVAMRTSMQHRQQVARTGYEKVKSQYGIKQMLKDYNQIYLSRRAE